MPGKRDLGLSNLEPHLSSHLKAYTQKGSSRKRKIAVTGDAKEGESAEFDPIAYEAQFEQPVESSKTKRSKVSKDPNATVDEKRCRAFRKHAPKTYLDRLDRVRTQRMFLIDRSRSVSEDGLHPIEIVDIAGTTGNIYQVTIDKNPSCSCPDALKGNQCKHIIYVMVNVLKAREDLSYQLGLLSSELCEIFESAPALVQSDDPSATSSEIMCPGKRKPIEGDCPICMMEFEPDTEELVWCRAACGQNMHKECFDQWKRSKPGNEAKCVYCRQPWQEAPGAPIDVKQEAKTGEKNAEGYVNVGGAFGLSGKRDMSSYHPFWVRNQERKNRRNDQEDDDDDDYDDCY